MKFATAFAILSGLLVAKANAATVSTAVNPSSLASALADAKVSVAASPSSSSADIKITGNGGVNLGNIDFSCNHHCHMAIKAVEDNCGGKDFDCISDLSDDQLWNHVRNVTVSIHLVSLTPTPLKSVLLKSVKQINIQASGSFSFGNTDSTSTTTSS
ncbi:hypothetical protein FOB64_001244 [Candida albicans]|uniref:Uncharacterized protein n=1 Tax=Candida albicans TaxID=5476 RepID=A0A8H6C3C2_CANAX|nr:hypothetical protein FOB64_001244 [Candida albicans]